MKARLSLTLVLLLCCGAAMAQPNYELADQYSAKKVRAMVHSLEVRPHWFSDSDRFWYRWETSEGTQYYIVDAAKGTRTPVFDMEKLAMELSEIVKDPFDAKHIPLMKLKLRDDSKFTFEIKSTQMVDKKDKKKKDEVKEGEKKDEKKDEAKDRKPEKPKKENKIFRFEYDIASNTLKDVTEEDEIKDYPRWANISPDGTRALYTKNRDLYWMSIDDVRKLMEDDKDSTVVEHRLTTDATAEFYYGGSNYRATEMKDTTTRMFASALWSPDGSRFAIPKFDMRPVKELWVIRSTSQPRPTLESYKYQMPGEPGPVDYLCLFSMADESQRTINVDAFKDQTIDILNKPMLNKDANADYPQFVWLGDNEKFYIQRTSRDLKRVDICTVNVNDTIAKPVIEERLNTYVETRPLRLLNDGSEMLWWSERNGWANLYLYGADGTLKNPVANGAFHVESILSVDEKARVVYFLAMGVDKNENPYNGHVYRVGLDGKGMKCLDEANYNSTVPSFSDDSRYFVNTYSRVDCAPMATVFDANGRKVCALDTADFSQLLAAGYQFPTPFKVKAADGVTDLYGYMYKPYDFDSTKTYPIIDYVYPGPQVEGNSEAWSSGFTRKDRLAQIGFIVVTVGNRGGHPNRSKWYHNFGYGNLRDYGLEDQKYAIQQLAARHNFIDITRVGIHGHSGGGFMSTAAILSYPDFFKAAVSCAGNHDNSIYNRWWSEQHHGILEEISAKGDTTFRYSIDKNQSLAKNLKGHLLLVHGDIDDNVHPGNTIRVVDALIRANKRFEMLILPGQRHGFGDMNEYFFWRMADWYSEWLLGSSRRDQVDIRELNND
ncbi:MAG: DPP IV N-terminal domain-containing protein [Bacteroidales bacterium]|nr:DPP IV N-terminal domain-containing protein [Bacteroidales bacterium]